MCYSASYLEKKKSKLAERYKNALPPNWKSNIEEFEVPTCYFVSQCSWRKGKEIFSLACVYDSWVDKSTSEVRNTFSIITTPANELMEKIHNVKKRKPLILNQNDEKHGSTLNYLDNQLPI